MNHSDCLENLFVENREYIEMFWEDMITESPDCYTKASNTLLGESSELTRDLAKEDFEKIIQKCLKDKSIKVISIIQSKKERWWVRKKEEKEEYFKAPMTKVCYTRKRKDGSATLQRLRTL